MTKHTIAGQQNCESCDLLDIMIHMLTKHKIVQQSPSSTSLISQMSSKHTESYDWSVSWVLSWMMNCHIAALDRDKNFWSDRPNFRIGLQSCSCVEISSPTIGQEEKQCLGGSPSFGVEWFSLNLRIYSTSLRTTTSEILWSTATMEFLLPYHIKYHR